MEIMVTPGVNISLDRHPDVAKCFGSVYSGKRVLVTGHTGFKGSWLTEWLLALGAEVTGFSLAPPTRPSVFQQLELSARINHVEGDVRDLVAVKGIVEATAPDFVFHLAAQALVRSSYVCPVETYATNVMGTVNVLEALRTAAIKPVVAVIITTDKCYDNKEWVHSYREEDPMGGYDPYSSSKGAAELVINSYRRSFLSTAGIKVASARAGNVIGGGDWALDRIVPDAIRALQEGRKIAVRNRLATRPWQHVLEPLSGYLWLGACLFAYRNSLRTELASAFNFGPPLSSNRTVADLVEEVLKNWPGQWEDQTDPEAVHEAKLLNLATDKAYHLLRWRPTWDFQEAVSETVRWYRVVAADPACAAKETQSQISTYSRHAATRDASWTRNKDE